MVELDKERLAKLLSMTSSDHDAEALAAIRKANELLRLNKKSWSDVLGSDAPAIEPPRPAPPSSTRPPAARSSPSRPPPYGPPPRTAEPPLGYQRLNYYRDALRHEPFLPRLLGFPFWLVIELVAIVFPNILVNTRGRFIALIFALGMLAGIAGWISLGYYLLFVA
jgi:hypothetical protein